MISQYSHREAIEGDHFVTADIGAVACVRIACQLLTHVNKMELTGLAALHVLRVSKIHSYTSCNTSERFPFSFFPFLFYRQLIVFCALSLEQ